MTRTFSLLIALVLLVPGLARAEGNVTPEAADVITKVGQAYAKLKTLDLAGKLSGDFDVDGQKEASSVDFTSSFAAPNRFRREVVDDTVVGSTGEKLYLYAKARRLYTMTDAPKGKVATSELPDPFPELLGIKQTRDPSLALALSNDPAGELTKSYPNVAKAADVTVDGKAYTALKFSKEKTGPGTTLLIDPATNLLRRVIIDVSGDLLARGASDVKKALLTIDYTASKADDGAAKPAEEFAWVPPPGAKDAADIASADADESEASKALLGKQAPDFKLKDLDGKEVALADLKGSVVVLDFWATWCGPCVESLPKIDKLFQDKKGDGLKVFAVNQAEDKELVGGFMKSRNLSVPVLLDSDSKIGNSYKAEAIPETVVIGKDGTVRLVLVGSYPENEKKLRDAVEAAMKASK